MFDMNDTKTKINLFGWFPHLLFKKFRQMKENCFNCSCLNNFFQFPDSWHQNLICLYTFRYETKC